MDTLLDALLDGGCLGYDGKDGPERREAASAQLQLDPSLADANLFTAAMLGRSKRVTELLAADSAAAARPGGPRDWPPLLYLCFSRVDARCKGESYVQAATALLDAGADANSEWLWGETYRFTALTGCFGEGESGPRAQPEHCEMEALAQLLLDRGANPNDGQALYNRMFTADSTCLRMLLDAGLQPTDRINWPVGKEPNQTTMNYQLFHAARKGFADRVDLLIEHGANLAERDNGQTVWKAAMVSGQRQIAARLEQAGVLAESLTPIESCLSAFHAGAMNEVSALLGDDPKVRAEFDSRLNDLLADAAAHGDLDAIKLLRSHGADPNANRHTPAAHQAAYHGRVEALKLLIAHGGDPLSLDQRFSATALGWAEHAGQQETAAFLRGWKASQD